MSAVASNKVADHGHATKDKFYRAEALDQLMKKMRFHQAAEMDVIPLRNGIQVQWFRDNVPTYNITPTTEGQSGAGLTGSGVNVTASVSQYADHMTFSDVVINTSLDGRVSRHAKTMGYRAALSNDTIIRNVIDAAATEVTPVAGADGYMARADLAKVAHTFSALDMQPLESTGKYFAIVSPYVSYDLMNGTGTGEIQDLLKHTDPNRVLQREDRGFVAEVNGVQVYESTNVTVTSGSPNTYRGYVFANGGYCIVDLAGNGPSKVVDPKNEQFSLTVKSNLPVDLSNPEGKVKSLISYNYMFAAASKDTVNKRIRFLDFGSSIAA